jgi:hypothetical protein
MVGITKSLFNCAQTKIDHRSSKLTVRRIDVPQAPICAHFAGYDWPARLGLSPDHPRIAGEPGEKTVDYAARLPLCQ